MPKVTAVVPTCRGFKIPEQSIPVDWVIVHDRERWSVEGKAEHIVAPDPQFYGQRCDSIRSAGFLKAHQSGADFILTVDDDCQIPYKWAADHVKALSQELHPWWPTIAQARTRGTPYKAKYARVAISHGIWDGVPDLDGVTQEKLPDLRITSRSKWHRISAPFTQSSMNLGFRREATCVMYQPNQGESTPFDRFADIWGGLLSQYCLAKHNYAFLNGGAIVEHNRASNLATNLIKEAPGMSVHEDFWEYVWKWHIKGRSLPSTYALLADHIGGYLGENEEQERYFEQLGRNMMRWLRELREIV